MNNAFDKLAETNGEQGNSIDVLMGTCLGVMNTEALKNMRHWTRQLVATQDGADFYNESNGLLARYSHPFTSRNDWYSLEAAQEAAAMFLRDNPTYKLSTGL